MLPDKDKAPRWVKDAANVATRTYGLATAHWRAGPDFIIPGTKRGGTTSLWNNLLQHPEVVGLYPQNRGRKSTDYFFNEGYGSQRWYRSHFPAQPRISRRARQGLKSISGEASPYYMYGPHCMSLIAREFPETQIIILLRDPVERAYSHFQERRKQGVETLDFEAALAAEESRLAPDEQRWLTDPGYYSENHDFMSYRSRGVYLPQVQRTLEAFPAEQVLIARAEDFYTDYQAAFDEVTSFLGIRRWTLPSAEHHNRIPRSPMREETRAELQAFYQPYNAALEEFLGRRLDWQ